MVPGADAVGGTFPPIKNSLSGDNNESPGTPFCPVSAPQGPQEVHGLHFLVPGASAVGGTSPPMKNSLFRSPNKSVDTSIAPVSTPQGLQEAIISYNCL